MSIDNERVFVVGASDDIESMELFVILRRKGSIQQIVCMMKTKLKIYLNKEIDSGHLNVVVGNYESSTYIHLLFELRRYGREGIFGYLHTTVEEVLWKLVEETSNEGSLVVLHLQHVFVNNHFMGNAFHVNASELDGFLSTEFR